MAPRSQHPSSLAVYGSYLPIHSNTHPDSGSKTRAKAPIQDELFHIPQAQRYCASDFHTWDPKLTTPPGLYAFSLLLRFVTRGGCDGEELRGTGGVALAALLVVCFCLRGAVRGELNREGRVWDVAHEALNVCLFPPLFFFSGLYYTDVLSTLVVVVSYFAFQLGAGDRSVAGGVVAYGLGILALVMRQTNVFWVGVFLAGMDWVKACRETQEAAKTIKERDEVRAAWSEILVRSYKKGEIHDPPLEQAGPVGKHTIENCDR